MALKAGDIKALVRDPESFLKVNLLETRFDRNIAMRDQLVKLVPDTAENSYKLMLADTASDDTISAHVLGYEDNKVNDAKYLDIPSTDVEGKLFFTYKLTGCSLVVTRLQDSNMYRVFHDNRKNSAILYDNVEMCVDCKDYKLSGQFSFGCAVVCMQFKEGAWRLYVQQQYPNLHRIMELRVDVKRSENTSLKVSDFEEARGWMQRRIKDLAKALKVESAIIDAAEDGSISEWNKLRNTIQKELDEEITQAEAEAAKLKKIDPARWRTKAAKNSFLFANYTAMVDDAKKIDNIWLWLQIKKATGSSVRESEGGEEPPSDTIGELYAEKERNVSSPNENTQFMKGYQNYGSIDIPHFKSSMTSSEMKELFVMTDDLSEEAQGALCRRISNASNLEKLLEQQQEIQTDFRSHSKGFFESAPQHFFLSIVGDKYGGRCYPLVRVMAVALSKGEKAAKGFLDKLREFSQDKLTPSQQKNAIYLRDALADLHANADAHFASAPQPNVFDITQVVRELRSSKQSEFYALHTQEHSMLVGVTVSDETKTRNYYFYDPNFLVAGFDSDSQFQHAVEHFFVNREFAKTYKAFSSAEEPKFKMVLIDSGEMGKARVDGGITVTQISSGIDLGDIFDERERSHVVGIAESCLAGDLNLRAALSAAEAYEWTARWRDASIRLAQEEGVTGNWAPMLDTLHESTDGSYKMQYFNANNTEETRWVSTGNTTFKKFKSYLDTKWMALRKNFIFENGKFKGKATATPEGEPIDGLNAMFVVQTIIHWLDRGGNAEESAPGKSMNAELALAMKMHSYVNMVQIAHSTILDINKVASLVKTAVEVEQLAGEVSLSIFSKVFKFSATEGLAVCLGIFSVVLDASELSSAQNDVDRAIFGTQLAFDLASSVTGVAGLGAGAAAAAGVGGAAVVATALSAAGVILAGLGIGIGALAQSFGKIVSDAQEVGRYFATLDEAYSGGGYKYETNEKALVPLPEAVVTSIKMADKEIQVGFDSQFIYRTHHGPTGSGRQNYFFWAGDMPQMVRDRSQAINVREGIGYKDNSIVIKLDGQPDCVLLPITRKSFISYDYQLLPGATSRHDRGFDVIRRLEEDYRFDYDFYIFPSEYTIHKIMFEYVETKISVVLDKRCIRLQMYLDLPKELHGYLSYEVEGTGGGEYCIGLATGYSLSLNTSGSDAKETTWIIDGSTLGDVSIEVGKDFVTVGGITIHLLSREFNRLLVISSAGEVSRVDLESQQASIQSIDAGKWIEKNEITIQQHLQKLAKEHRLSARFVLVNNYTPEEKGHERQVGRAYYDVSVNRMLYIDVEADIGCEIIDVLVGLDGHFGGDQPTGKVYTAAEAQDDAVITRDACLGAIVGDDAYFFHTQQKRVWRVNAETHRITAKYYTCTQFEDSDFEISSFTQHADFPLMAITPINQAGKGVEQIMYHIHKDNMVLSTVICNSDMFRRIYTKERLSWYDLVGGRERASAMGTMFSKFADQSLVLPSNAEIVTVLCKDESGGHEICCWLRTSDDTLIRASVQQRPNDLILTVSSHKVNGKEVFYFYSVNEEAVYVQQGPGHSNDSQAKQIKVAGLTNLFSVHGEVFATTKAGLILRVLGNGSLYLEAVNEHWLAEHPKWWLDLANLDGKKSTLISVLGVKDNKNKAVSIWYQDGKVVIASSKLHGKQLQFLGVIGNGDNQDALLFDIESGLLYRQPLISTGALVAMINSEWKLVNEIPEAETMLYGEKVKLVAKVDGNLHVTTESGVVLVVGGHRGMATLVAVDRAWLQASSHDLKVNMEKLAKNWSHTDVVELQGDNVDSMPEWYHISSEETLTAKDLKWSYHPMWIGKSIDDCTFYIYAQHTLYAVHKESGTMTEKGRFAAAEVQGNSLVLQSIVPNAEINIPTLVGFDFCVVTASNAKVVIDAENWKQYKVITINNNLEGNGERMVEIKHSDEHLLVHKMGNDMVFVDASKGSSVNLANVLLAEEAEEGSYKVKVGLRVDEEEEEKEFMISSIHECLGKVHPLLANGIFSITEIIDLIKFKQDNPE